jgi:hypothetical protein
VSSKSLSPDDKIPKPIEFYENDDTVEDEFEDGIRTSQQTGKSSDFKFNNNSNVVIERNDRFIIFKMVVSIILLTLSIAPIKYKTVNSKPVRA